MQKWINLMKVNWQEVVEIIFKPKLRIYLFNSRILILKLPGWPMSSFLTIQMGSFYLSQLWNDFHNPLIHQGFRVFTVMDAWVRKSVISLCSGQIMSSLWVFQSIKLKIMKPITQDLLWALWNNTCKLQNSIK